MIRPGRLTILLPNVEDEGICFISLRNPLVDGQSFVDPSAASHYI
jgi:hypothetical protein